MGNENIIQLFAPLFQDRDDFQYLLDNKPLLAHYTSVTVLEKILKDDELWLSNPLFMNDLEEMRFGIHQGVSRFRQLKNQIIQASGSPERFDMVEAAFMENFRQFDTTHALDVYVFCLAQHTPNNDDGLLSMWRAYGGNGNGAALVFNTNFLTEQKAESPLIIARVHYASANQRIARLDKIISDWCDIVSSQFSDRDLCIPAYILFSAIKVYALSSKHHGFCEEREWRIIYLPDHDPTGLMKKHLHYIVGRLGVEPKLRFPIRPLDIKSPEKWTFESILDGIILGPSVSNALARSSIVRMLEVIGKPTFGSKVVSSTIPLRPT